MSSGFNIMMKIVPVISIAIFVFAALMIFSPRIRGKMMSRQIKAAKYMMDESKEAIGSIAETAGDVMINSSKNVLDKNKDKLSDMAETLGNVAINSRKRVLDENEDALRDMMGKSADIGAIGIEKTARAIKKGLSETESVYCKHCGAPIDGDSKFCKKCGGEQ